MLQDKSFAGVYSLPVSIKIKNRNYVNYNFRPKWHVTNDNNKIKLENSLFGLYALIYLLSQNVNQIRNKMIIC